MIPNQWYAIYRSQDLKRGKPVGVKRLGENLVLFRRRDGSVACLHDRCPHKGAQLSLGRVIGDTVECPYHGFRFDEEGRCTLMPCAGVAGRIPKGMCTKSYRVREEYNYVWFWWGDDRAQLPEIPMFPEFRDCEGGTSAWEAPIPYTRYVESVSEAYHLPFIHRGSWINLWDPRGGRVDDFEVEIDGTHVKTKFILRPDDARSNEEVLHAKLPWTRGWRVRVELLMPNMCAFLADPFDAMFICTPIDEENTWTVVRFNDIKSELLLPIIPSLPLPRSFKRLRARFLAHLEKTIQQPKDLRVALTATPRHPDLTSHQFAAVDVLNTQFLKLREKLKAEAAAAPHVNVSRLRTAASAGR